MTNEAHTPFMKPPVLPPERDERFRIEMTVGCKDAERIPKVAGAGQIFKRGEKHQQIMHNGVKVTAGGYHGKWMAEIIERLRGHHEPQEEVVFDAIVRLMPATPTMIELGCFWAYYSLWLMQARPAAHVIGLEPDPVHLAVGRANCDINERSIDFINASIGAEALAPRAFNTETSGLVNIPQFTVPQIMSERRISELDILHCDVQGAETDVLVSCVPLFERNAIRFCVVSTHHHYISGDALTHQRCISLIENAGGRIIAEHSIAESYSGDGMIAAYFGKEPLYWDKPHITYNRCSQSLFRDPLFDLASA